MSTARRLRLLAMAALAVTTVLWAAVALAAINGGGAARVGGITLLEIAIGYDRAVGQILGKSQQNEADLVAIERGARASLAQYPYNSRAWLRLALVDTSRHGRLTAPGLAALRRSYDLVQLEPNIGPQRVAFGLENWEDLPNDLQIQITNEASDLGANAKMREKLRRTLRRVQSPYGAVLGRVWMRMIDARAATAEKQLRGSVS